MRVCHVLQFLPFESVWWEGGDAGKLIWLLNVFTCRLANRQRRNGSLQHTPISGNREYSVFAQQQEGRFQRQQQQGIFTLVGVRENRKLRRLFVSLDENISFTNFCRL